MGYLKKGLPFSYKGTIDVSDCVTSEDVIKKAKLDWEVAKCEIVAKMPMNLNPDSNRDGFNYGGMQYTPVESMYATYRTDLNFPLGVVKENTGVVACTTFFFFSVAHKFSSDLSSFTFLSALYSAKVSNIFTARLGYLYPH